MMTMITMITMADGPEYPERRKHENRYIGGTACHKGQVRQDLFNLNPLVAFQFLDLVIHVNGFHRFDEESGAGGRAVVDHARKCIPVFDFYGDTVSSVTHGYERIHKKSLVGLGLYDLIQKAVQSGIKLGLLTSDRLQRR